VERQGQLNRDRADTDQETVAAIVVTYDRRDLLRQTLQALLAQTRPVDEVVVVDNASRDGTADMLAAEFPTVCHLALPHNTGPAGGFAAGMEYAAAAGHQWLWLFNDDDRPLAGALETLLAAAGRLRQGGQLAMVGSWLLRPEGDPLAQCYRWRHRYRPVANPSALGGEPYPVDGTIFAGLLVAASLVAAIGLPKRQYFMMFEEVEYCLRARDRGKGIYMLPQPLTLTLHQGSKPGEDTAWRGYYQTRNQLAMSLERRSSLEVWWWAVRQAKFLVATLIGQDRKRRRIGMRLLGMWHGARGVMGRTIEPPLLATHLEGQRR
jgi:rhamnopyranosyl-N-acetylglucosaminyl-diphospho-decaprenol beta-1,3/1,4-galactofuranosyltransferase